MSWERILKNKDAVKAIARDFGEYANNFDYGYTSQIFELSPKDLEMEMKLFMMDFEKHYEKGRIDEARKNEIQAPVEKLIKQLENTLRVKDWDEGRI